MAKKSKNDLALKIVYPILILVAIVMVMPSILWVYYKCNPSKLPDTRVVSYVSSIIDENGEERNFLELEYWEDAYREGDSVLEISMNAYTDPVHSTNVVKKYGVQYNLNHGRSLTDATSFCYEKVGTSSWQPVDALDSNSPLYVDINGEAYSLTLSGKYTYQWQTVDARKIAETVGSLSLNMIVRSLMGQDDVYSKDFFYKTNSEERTYTMIDFYSALFNSVTVNNVPYGTNILSLVDLSRYFEIKHEVGGDWVLVDLYNTSSKDYFAVKVTKHAEAFLRASDSTYGMFLGDATHTLVDTDNIINDYTGINEVVTLNYSDFDYSYCPQYDGYVAVLKDSMRSSFNGSRANDVVIDLDFSTDFFRTADKPVIGILYDFCSVSQIKLTFEQDTFPLFYSFYLEGNREYLPTSSAFVVTNKTDDRLIFGRASEVQI